MRPWAVMFNRFAVKITQLLRCEARPGCSGVDAVVIDLAFLRARNLRSCTVQPLQPAHERRAIDKVAQR